MAIRSRWGKDEIKDQLRAILVRENGQPKSLAELGRMLSVHAPVIHTLLIELATAGQVAEVTPVSVGQQYRMTMWTVPRAPDGDRVTTTPDTEPSRDFSVDEFVLALAAQHGAPLSSVELTQLARRHHTTVRLRLLANPDLFVQLRSAARRSLWVLTNAGQERASVLVRERHPLLTRWVSAVELAGPPPTRWGTSEGVVLRALGTKSHMRKQTLIEAARYADPRLDIETVSAAVDSLMEQNLVTLDSAWSDSPSPNARLVLSPGGIAAAAPLLAYRATLDALMASPGSDLSVSSL